MEAMHSDGPTPARADGGHKQGTLKQLATFSPSLLLGTPTRLRQVIIVPRNRRAAELNYQYGIRLDHVPTQ
jgi:hypothetical protein